MRTVAVGKGAVSDSLVPILSYLAEVMGGIAADPNKVPTKAWFSHYMFETLSCAIKYACPAGLEVVAKFEECLFPPFQGLLQNGVVG